jgi:putative oxidoreductase
VPKTVDTAKLTQNSGTALAVFRVVLGFMFTLHGTQKLLAWPPAEALQAAVPIGTWPAWWAGVVELVAGALITLGLFTRIAAFIASGTMAVAYFWQHAPTPSTIEPAQGPPSPPAQRIGPDSRNHDVSRRYRKYPSRDLP